MHFPLFKYPSPHKCLGIMVTKDKCLHVNIKTD